MHDYSDYARFLPEDVRARAALPPHESWWPWRGRRVHVARARHPDSPVRLVVIHGGGGHSHALWPVAALPAGHGVDVAAPDLPLYGRTVEPGPAGVRYPDWLDLLCDFVAAEDDGRPLVLFGASIGGMLAYEVAGRTNAASAVLATCLLDPTDPEARTAASRFDFLGRPAPALLRIGSRVAGRLRVPIKWIADLDAMSRDPELSRLCATDPRGGGTRVPLGWMSSFFNHVPPAPETFTGTPVTLVHPERDTWTPPELSLRFLNRIAAPTQSVMLTNCGHFPIEQPGVSQLEQTLLDTISAVTRR